MKHGNAVFSFMIVFALVACAPHVTSPTTSPAAIPYPFNTYATFQPVPHPVNTLAVSQPIPTSALPYSVSSEIQTMVDALIYVIKNVITPIVIAILTYIVVDRLGEWRKRKTYSKLGVAIIESLQEEIKTGIQVMTDALNITEDQSVNEPPVALLPKKSWSGMSTIPDEVLLRIIETSANRQFDGFPLRECRIHCKNYFEHISQNYEQAVFESMKLTKQGQDWRRPILNLLANDARTYIQAAKGVDRMLDNAKQLLEANSRAIFPK